MTRRSRWWRAWRAARMTVKVTVILALTATLVPVAAAGVAVGTLVFFDLPGNLPPERHLAPARPSRVYDAAGNEIAVFRQFDSNIPVSAEDLPQVLVDAVVASEDRRFWEHDGVDVEALVRAAWANLRNETVQGGSTITQQYVKNAFTGGERTFSRKVREAILAQRLERQLTKQEILYRYLSTVYLGEGAYGVGAASETYFRKHVRDLTLSEAALLVGLIPAPSAYSPRAHPGEAERQRIRVLTAMREIGVITREQLVEASGEHIWLTADAPAPPGATAVHPPEHNGATQYPYFVDYVRRYLIDRFGPELVYRGGLRIETTLDPGLQFLAETSVGTTLEGTEAPLEMSLVAVDPRTGWVKALVGGRDWAASQVNLALGGDTGFQPGSSFKPFVLAAAMERGITPDAVYPAPGSWRVPDCGGDNCVLSNYGGGGGGSQTLADAMVTSTNTVFAQLIYDVGVPETAELAHRLGVLSVNPTGEGYGLSLSLGAAEVSPLEMAAAYAVFANHGLRVPPTPVAKVIDPDGVVLEDRTIPAPERVLDAAVADTVSQVLTGVLGSRGTGRRAAIGRPAAGKTGTAEDYQAAWFVGYTPDLVASVWMGYRDRPEPLRNIKGVGSVTGGSHPAVAWARFMRAALAEVPPTDFPTPGPLPPPPERADRGDPQEAPARARTVEAQGRQSPSAVAADCGGPCEERPALDWNRGAPTASGVAPPATTTTSTTSTTAPSTTPATAPAAAPVPSSAPPAPAPGGTGLEGTGERPAAPASEEEP